MDTTVTTETSEIVFVAGQLKRVYLAAGVGYLITDHGIVGAREFRVDPVAGFIHRDALLKLATMKALLEAGERVTVRIYFVVIRTHLLGHTDIERFAVHIARGDHDDAR